MFEAASVPGVDREKLVYFGVSVFWRAAVHRWRLPSAPSENIGLGPYEDQLRRYLLGKAEFPRDALILTTVSYSTEEMRNRFVTFPWLYKRDSMGRQFKMIVTGVTYQLFTGKVMLPGLRDLCTVRSEQGFIFMADRTDLINIDNNVSMLKTSHRVGKLLKTGGALLSDGITKR